MLRNVREDMVHEVSYQALCQKMLMLHVDAAMLCRLCNALILNSKVLMTEPFTVPLLHLAQ